MTVVLLIDVVMTIKCMWRGLTERSNWKGGDGTRTQSLFLEKNRCHYTAATGQWFTTAYSPYSSTGLWSPCRLNVEQHHDWDATSIHSPPLQQLWLTAQHTLFNLRKRAPRLRLKPMFLWMFLLWMRLYKQAVFMEHIWLLVLYLHYTYTDYKST